MAVDREWIAGPSKVEENREGRRHNNGLECEHTRGTVLDEFPYCPSNASENGGEEGV
jgi:hypothetical protein